MEKVLIWGTGGNAVEFLERIDPEKLVVVGCIDNDSEKRGTNFLGTPVYAPEAVSGLDFDRIIICSTHFPEIREQLSEIVPECRTVYSTVENMPSLMKAFGLDNPYKDLSPETIELLEKPVWYHRFEILPGMETTGRQRWNPEKLNYFEAKDDARGKTVLDIGAWDGPYTFEMERRGAEVTAYDIQDPAASGFHAAQKVNGSKAKYIRGSVYDLNPRDHGTYDIVLFLGVYYHLQSPLQALLNIHSVLNPGGLMVFEGAVLDGAPRVDKFWRKNAHILPAILETPFCFYVKDRFEEDWSNWSIPTAVCLRDWIESAGFEVLALDKRESDARVYGAARKTDDFVLNEHEVD